MTETTIPPRHRGPSPWTPVRVGLLAALAVGATQCVSDGDEPARRGAAVVAECTDDPTTLPDDAWVCPDALTVECDGGDGTADVGTIYAEPADDMTVCADTDFVVSDAGPFTVGTHTVTITEDSDDSEVCSAELTVEDTVAPTVTDAGLELWPPNHRMVFVDPLDCVTVDDACDPDGVEVRFTRASSDEPVDARGDGRTDPDIEFDDCGVKLRAERQGGGDGRVYTLDYVATDAAGNETTGTCTVTVPHDRSGRPAGDDGPAYSVTPDDDDFDDCSDDDHPGDDDDDMDDDDDHPGDDDDDMDDGDGHPGDDDDDVDDDDDSHPGDDDDDDDDDHPVDGGVEDGGAEDGGVADEAPSRG